MAAHYAIMRFAKDKGPEISGIEVLDERTKEKYVSNPDVDTSLTQYNFHLIEPKGRYRAEECHSGEQPLHAREAAVQNKNDLLSSFDYGWSLLLLAIMMFLPFTPENTSGRMLFRFTLKTPVLSYISRKDVTLITLGSVIADSKKSLSPVRN